MANKEPRFCAFSDVGKPPRPHRFLPPFRSSNSPGNTRGAAVGKLPCKLQVPLPHVRKPVPCLTRPGQCLPPLSLRRFSHWAWPVQPWQLLAVGRASLAPAARGVPSLPALPGTADPAAQGQGLHPRCPRPPLLRPTSFPAAPTPRASPPCSLPKWSENSAFPRGVRTKANPL